MGFPQKISKGKVSELRMTMMTKRWSPGTLLFLLLLALTGATCARAPKQKVFVLGIDGLTFDLLVPWAQEGKLPHFAQLLEEGSSTQLVSAVPPSSPPAWTSAITGVNPGKHGIFGFIKDIQTTSDGRPNLIYYTARDRRADPLWVILSERGRRSVVVNVPATSPPDKVKGVMISGFPHTSLTNFTYPPEFRFKIPNYRKDIYGQEVSVEGNEDFLKDLIDITDRRAKVIFKLIEEEPWELFFVTFTITDRVQHYFWKFMDPQHPDWTSEYAQLYGDAILKAYQKMDGFLGELRSRLDAQTTLLIMSDHGFGPIYQPINGENFIDLSIPSGDFRVVSADQFGAKFHLVTQKDPPYDRKTRESYTRTKELLKNKLEQLRDPTTGKKVIQTVFDRKDIYWGPYIDMAPDLLGLETKGYLFWNWNPREDGGIFLQKEDPVFKHFLSGFHLMNGVLIMAGANVQGKVNNFDAQIIDIAPTVLYLLDEPIPEEMDGKILSAPIPAEYTAEHPLDVRWDRESRPPRAEGLSDSSEAINKLVEEQLRAIGYVQ
jgi:predicted AlkP superfamily phosphohydrolase/phosphomutase